MWILESSDDFLQGKRMWLKPGQKYIFGRVKRDGVRFAVDHKTVSRKHFTIEVDTAKDADVANIHARTRITITDEHSKAGTWVNGDLVKGGSGTLKNLENSVRPGNAAELVIKWHPCVLSVNLQRKEIKAGLLKTKQDRVKDWDVKVISEFVSEATTHLVVKKRNTPKGLQALITGKHLVAESYIDALEYAITPSTLSQEENLSPLELDYDQAWPDPDAHLPPAGKEPTLRGPESYRPNHSRANIFEDFIFIFGDQVQYDNLLPVVTTGNGKALLFKVTLGETTVEELVKYMREIAGSKGLGSTQDSAHQGGAVIVRWNRDDQYEEFTNRLINDASLQLDQRAIDQAEFLDAILANDPYLLRQPLPYESTTDGIQTPPPSAATLRPISQTTQQVVDSSRRVASASTETTKSVPKALAEVNPGPTSSTKVKDQDTQHGAKHQASAELDSNPRPAKRARTHKPATRFQDFLDDFDPSQVVPYDEDPVPDQEAPASSQGDREAVKDEPKSTSKEVTTGSAEREVQNSDDNDELFPAAAAMRRLKQNGKAQPSQVGTASEPKRKVVASTTARVPKKEKDIDVRGIARAQKEAQEEAARKEQEGQSEEGEETETGPARLAVIQYFNLPVRDNKPTRANGHNRDDWDPKWNGRKNFKGFKKKGDERKLKKTIIPLVEAKSNNYGIGEKYWDRTEEEREEDREREKRKKASQRKSQASQQTQSSRTNGTLPADAVEEEERTSPAVSRLQQEAADIVDEDIDVDAPRRTRAADTQTQRGKRPASRLAAGANKRQKTLPVTVVHGSASEESDSDDMKFRFGQRSRRGRGKA